MEVSRYQSRPTKVLNILHNHTPYQHYANSYDWRKVTLSWLLLWQLLLEDTAFVLSSERDIAFQTMWDSLIQVMKILTKLDIVTCPS
jgi:hypothetical protein